jgi:hypothetical protein
VKGCGRSEEGGPVRAFWLTAALAGALVASIAWSCVRVRAVADDAGRWARSPAGREALHPVATAFAGLDAARATQTAIAPTVRARRTAAATSTALAVARTPRPPPQASR